MQLPLYTQHSSALPMSRTGAALTVEVLSVLKRIEQKAPTLRCSTRSSNTYHHFSIPVFDVRRTAACTALRADRQVLLCFFICLPSIHIPAG